MDTLLRVAVVWLCLGLAGEAVAGDTPDPAANEDGAKMLGEVTTEEIPAQTVMALRLTGSYEQHGNAIMQLMMYAAPRGIVQGAPFGQYFNSPKDVPADSLRWEVGVPVAAGTESSDSFIVYEMPAFQAAVMTCVGPYGQSQTCFDGLYAYIEKNGLEVAGPIQEHWLSDQQVPPEEQRARIVIPVRTKK